MSVTIARVRVAKQIPGRPAASTTEAAAARDAAQAAQAAAETAQGAAASSASSASTSASTATTQAGIATTKAGEAASSASAASTSAGTATAQATAAANSATAAAGSASSAATQAGIALGHANDANAERVLAQTARAGAEEAAGSAETSRDVATSQAETATEAAESAALSAEGIQLTANGGPFANVAALEAALSEGESAFTRDGTAYQIIDGAAVELFSFPSALRVIQLLDRFQSDIPLSDGVSFLFGVLLNGAPMLRVVLDAERRESGMTELAGVLLTRDQVLALEDLPEDVLLRIAVRAGPDGVTKDYVLADWIVENGVPALDVPQFSEATLRAIGGGLPIPEFMFEDEAGAAATALQVATYGGQRYVWGAVLNSLTALPELVETIDLHLSYGESNSENGGLASTGLVATEGVINRHRALMFSTGYLGSQGTAVNVSALGDFIPGVEVDSASAGESGGSSFLRKTLADATAIGLPDMAIVYRTTGMSGQTIATGDKVGLGDPAQIPYQNFGATIGAGITTAALYAKRLRVPHFNWTQGYNEDQSTAVSYYEPLQVALIDNLQREIVSRTGQAVMPWMLIDILVASDIGGYRSGVALAQVAALTYRKCAAPTCASYWFNGSYGFNTGQNVHWKPVGKALLKEYTAKAGRIVREAMAQNPDALQGGFDDDGNWVDADLIWRWVYNGDDEIWERKLTPFETSPRANPDSFQISGSTITFRVPYAEGGLSIWDDLRGPATDYGFAWSGAQTITNVTVGTGETDILVTITFSGAPTAGQTLTYAIADTDTTADAAPSAWGDLFDNCAEPSLAVDGLTLRQGLLPFSVVVS